MVHSDSETSSYIYIYLYLLSLWSLLRSISICPKGSERNMSQCSCFAVSGCPLLFLFRFSLLPFFLTFFYLLFFLRRRINILSKWRSCIADLPWEETFGREGCRNSSKSKQALCMCVCVYKPLTFQHVHTRNSLDQGRDKSKQTELWNGKVVCACII